MEAEKLLKRFDRLKADRSTYDNHCQEVAQRVWPDRASFLSELTPGAKRTQHMFDSTAPLALTRFAAAMESMLTPRTTRWHGLRHPDRALNNDQSVKRYMAELVEILFAVRYSSGANFASQMHEAYMSLGAFGCGGVFIEDMIGTGLRYKSIDISNTFFAENRYGVVDTMFREFKYTAAQAIQHFDALPEKITKAKPDDQFTFVHAVYPSERPGLWAWDSCYIAVEGKQIVETGGYGTFPAAVGRYITTPGEPYGRSPAMLVLPDIKTLNEMEKTMLRAAHLAVQPPLLLQEDGALQAFSVVPGALNYGGVDDRGNQLVHPLKMDARFDIGEDRIERKRKVINDAFMVTLFQILVETPAMTATEAMLRAQEKGALLAPTMGRQQSEMLGPLIERELDLLARAGQLPQPPDILVEAGMDYEVEYTSPLTRAQRAEDGVAIMRTFEALAPMAQLDPNVMMTFDPVKAARELAEINGVPPRIMRTEDEIAAMKAKQAQEAQMAQVLQAAPIAADTAKTLLETQALASQGQPAITTR